MGEESISVHGRVIFMGVEKCPSCQRDTLRVVEILYEDPAFGQMLLYSNICPICGFRRIDFQHLDSKGPSRIIYKIEDAEDVYRTYVLRSRTARIIMPELDFEIDPGPQAEAMITTVEGLLYRLLETTERLEEMGGLDEAAKAKLVEVREKAKKALAGQQQFTLIIEDPYGNSAIKPPRGREDKVIIEPLALNQGM